MRIARGWRRATALGVAVAALMSLPAAAGAQLQLVDSWGNSGTGPGQFDAPSGIAAGPDGSVYVADTENHRVQQFAADGSFIRQWGSEGGAAGQFLRPAGIEVDASGDVFVVEVGGMRVQRFGSGGAFEAKWGSFGEGPGQFSFPVDVAVDSAGAVYVPDLVDRVQKFDRDGGFLTEWGLEGSGPGQLDDPRGIAASAGGIYVADANNDRVQRFSPAGGYLGQLGSATPGGPGRLARPGGIDDAPGGELAVIDSTTLHETSSVATFTPSGSLLAEFGAGLVGSSDDLAFAPNGDLYVADPSADRVLRFAAEPRDPDPEPVPTSSPLSPSSATVTPPPAATGLLLILGRKLTLNRRGRLAVRLRCARPVGSSPCSGLLRLRPRGPIAGRRPLLARGRYRVLPGESRRVRLAATRRGERLLRRKPRARRVEAFTRLAAADGSMRRLSAPMLVRVSR